MKPTDRQVLLLSFLEHAKVRPGSERPDSIAIVRRGEHVLITENQVLHLGIKNLYEQKDADDISGSILFTLPFWNMDKRNLRFLFSGTTRGFELCFFQDTMPHIMLMASDEKTFKRINPVAPDHGRLISLGPDVGRRTKLLSVQTGWRGEIKLPGSTIAFQVVSIKE